MTPERFLYLLLFTATLAGAALHHRFGQTPGSEAALATVPPNPAPPARAGTGPDLLQPVPEKLLDFVRQDLGLPPAAHFPRLKLVSPDEIRNATERHLHFIYGPEGLAAQEALWQSLRLLRPGDSLQASWLNLILNGEFGLYDFASDTILLPAHLDLSDPTQQSILVRLLTYQRLARLRPPSRSVGVPPASIDAYRAWHALAMGTAYDTEKRFRQKLALNPESSDSPATLRDSLLLSFSPAFQNLANLPLIEGRQVSNAAYLASRSEFSALLTNPPASTLALLKLSATNESDENEKGEKNENAASPASPELSPNPEPPAGDGFPDALGAFGLRLLLDPEIGLQASTELSRHWRGDRLQLTSDKLTLRLRLSSPASANRVRDELQKIFPEAALELADTELALTLPLPADPNAHQP
ncbi:MAG: hypothetical protein ACQKBY_02000 [Verrucomicrobiales bacterium]